jgi:hypothetical protein
VEAKLVLPFVGLNLQQQQQDLNRLHSVLWQGQLIWVLAHLHMLLLSPSPGWSWG